MLRLCWLRWLWATLLGVDGRIRYARQLSIGRPFVPFQPDNRGGWNFPGQLDQASFVGSLPNGDICVADARNHRVHIFSGRGVPASPHTHADYRVLGGFGDGPGQLYRPAGCACESSSPTTLYVVDSYNHRLQKLNVTNGKPLSLAGQYGSGPGQLKFPHGISLSNGVLYVADALNHRIATFDTKLNFVFAFGKRGSGPGELSFPSGVAALGSTVYVADTGNDRLQVYTTRGKFLRSLGRYGSEQGQFNMPSDVSLAHGRIYVSEFHGRRVQVITPSGNPVQTLRLPDVGALSSVDADIQHERVYVADFEHHRVHVMAVRGVTVDNATNTTHVVVDRQDGGYLSPDAESRSKRSKHSSQHSSKHSSKHSSRQSGRKKKHKTENSARTTSAAAG